MTTKFMKKDTYVNKGTIVVLDIAYKSHKDV